MNYRNELLSPLGLWTLRGASLLGGTELFYRLYGRLKRARPDIQAFRDRHAGQRCFVLGGGPSLRLIDPAPLRNEVTFGVNACFLIYDWLGFQPTYYVVEDGLVYEDRFHDIREQVTDSTCFFPLQFSTPDFDRPNHNYFRAIYEFDTYRNWPNFSTQAEKMIWIGGTVTYVCLQLAYHMGFREVYLLGMDHNYARPDHVQVTGNEWLSQGADPNHFHPDYFGPGKRWHDPRVDRMECAYVKARTAFESDGRRVRNATVGGKLEVFERVPYESLFGR